MTKPIEQENFVERTLINRVKAMGGIAEKVTVLGRRGFFDRLVVLPGGRVIFVECKRPKGGRFSAGQILRHVRYRRCGAELAIVRTEEDIDHLLGSPSRQEKTPRS